MNARTISLLILGTTSLIGCRYDQCCAPCGTIYEFPQECYPQRQTPAGQTYYSNTCPDGFVPVKSNDGYFECLKRPVEYTNYTVISAYIKVDKIQPDPSGVNAVKLASGIEKALIKINPEMSLEHSKTRIINDKITLITKPRLNGDFTDSEVITATVKSDSKEVKIDAETVRRYQTPYGPTEATAPREVTKRFLDKLISAMGQKD